MKESIAKILQIFTELLAKEEYKIESLQKPMQATENLLINLKLINDDHRAYEELKDDLTQGLKAVMEYKHHPIEDRFQKNQLNPFISLVLSLGYGIMNTIDTSDENIFKPTFTVSLPFAKTHLSSQDENLLWSHIIYYYTASELQTHTGKEGLFLKNSFLPLLEILPEDDLRLQITLIEAILTIHTSINKYPHIDLEKRKSSFKKAGCEISSENQVKLPAIKDKEAFLGTLTNIETAIKENELKNSHLGNLLLHLNIRFRLKQSIENLSQDLNSTIEKINSLINATQINLDSLKTSVKDDKIISVLEEKINKLSLINDHLHQRKCDFLKNSWNQLRKCESNEEDILRVISDSRELIGCLLSICFTPGCEPIEDKLKEVSLNLQESELKCSKNLEEINQLRKNLADHAQNCAELEAQQKSIIDSLENEITSLKKCNSEHAQIIQTQAAQLSFFSNRPNNLLEMTHNPFHNIVVSLDYYCLHYVSYLNNALLSSSQENKDAIAVKISSVGQLRYTLMGSKESYDKIKDFNILFNGIQPDGAQKIESASKTIISNDRNRYSFVAKLFIAILTLDLYFRLKNETWCFWQSNGKVTASKIEEELNKFSCLTKA